MRPPTYPPTSLFAPPCSECELALDVFQQLLSEGCTPNLVVYNILIDIHGKSGQWAKAVEVLGMLQVQVCVCVAVGGLGRRGGAGTEVLDERCSKLALTWQPAVARLPLP